MDAILFALWFFLPAGLGNSAPVFASKIPILKKLSAPLDGGKTFRGKRIFGDHKTVRGLISGTLIGLLVGLAQVMVFNEFEAIRQLVAPVDYSQPWFVVLGAFMGAGALIADAIKSFFKRQVGIASGKTWFPFDQTDYLIGGIVASLPFVLLDSGRYVTIVLVWFFLHPVATLVGWLLHLKESPI